MKNTINIFKKVASGILAVAMLTSGINSTLAAEKEKEKVNVAKGKTVIAENTFGAGFVATNVLDENIGTVWSGPTEECELIIDLHQAYGIDSIDVISRHDMAQSVDISAILGSNTADFTIYEELVGEFKVPDKSIVTQTVEQNKKYRYIKFQFPSYPCIADIYIYEKEVVETAVEVIYSDIEDKSLKNAVSLLSGLGAIITEDTVFDAEKEVTRAEFARFLADLMGISSIEAENPFTDIAGIPEESSIKTLYSINAMDEYAAGLFKPNLPIDAYSAAEMVVRALGYSGFAEATGNPKAVYQSKISELNLLRNVSKTGNLTRKDAAFLLVNALEAEVLEINQVSNNGSVKFTKGKTLLECKNITYNEGIVTENYMQSISHEWEDVAKGYVVIDGVIYATAYESMMFHVGEKVRFYYNAEDDKKTIICLHAVNNQKEIIIPADVARSISDGSVKWNNNDKIRSSRFSVSARIIYNGRPLGSGKSLSSCKPVEGYIRMLDYEGDGIYDTLIIFDYTDNVLKSVNKNKGVYNFEADKPALIIGEEKTAMWYRNGRVINPSSIKVGEVLSIGASTDGQHYEVYVGGSTREGKITAYTQGERESIEQDYLKTFTISKGFNNPEDIVPGERATIYTNYEGKAVYIDKDKSSKARTGILINVALSNGLDAKLQIQVFTTGGTLEIYTVAEKAILDGKRYNSKSEFLNALIRQSANEEGKFVDCFIRYTTDINAEILEIDTLYDGAETDGIAHINTLTGYPMYGIFEGKYRMQNGITDVFTIYTGEEKPEYRYESVSVDSRFINRVLYEGVEFYGSRKEPFDIIPIVVTRINGEYTAETSADAYYLLVDKVVQGLNRNEEQVPVVCGMYRGQYVKMPFEEKERVPDWIEYVNFGDILRVDVSKSNEIIVSLLKAEYTLEEHGQTDVMHPGYQYPSGGFMAPGFNAFGGAYKIEDGLLCVRSLTDMNSTTYFDIFTLSAFENVYFCDIETKEIRRGSSADIVEYVSDSANYSYIAARNFEGYHRDLVIYER